MPRLLYLQTLPMINLWLVPDGRGVCPFCRRHRDVIRHIEIEVLGIISRPAWCWNFNHAHVIEGTFGGIKIRIRPDRDQFSRTDGIGPTGVGDVYRVSNRGAIYR